MDKENKTSEEIRLLTLFDREWNYTLENSPEFGTFLGIHTYDNRLSDLSEETIERYIQHEKEIFEELNAFDSKELSETNKLNLELFKLKTENSIKDYPFKTHYMPLHQMHGVQNSFSRLISMMPFKKEKDYENYLSRINAFPLYIEQTIELMEKGLKEGLSVSKIAMEDVPKQIERQLPEDIKQSTFYAPLENSNVSQSLKDEIENGIKNKIYTSFKKLKDYLENKYIPSCRETIGYSDIKNGKELYNHLLQEYTTTNLTAEEIHETGKKEVERIYSEILDLMKKIGYEDYNEFLNFLRTNKEFYFTDEKTLMMNYSYFAKRVDKELPRFFKVLPRLPFAIEKVPDYQAPSSPTAFYMSPDLNMTRPGIYYANTSQLETRPSYELEPLTLHEAVPGHHLQIALSLEIQGLPEFRKISRFTGYVEGWALYAEKLGAEMGLYSNLYSKFGQLSFEIWRACRLVIDTGIHAFGWEREKSIEYLRYYTGKSREASAVEVDRYIVMPAQATAYKIGEIKILELRKKFEEVRGEDFDVREFHDLILRNGALPLNVLENYVNEHLMQ